MTEPFLITEISDLKMHLEYLIDINTDCYHRPFTTFDNIKMHWDFEEDVTDSYDLSFYVNNSELLKYKPDRYIKLVEHVKTNDLLKM